MSSFAPSPMSAMQAPQTLIGAKLMFRKMTQE